MGESINGMKVFTLVIDLVWVHQGTVFVSIAFQVPETSTPRKWADCKGAKLFTLASDLVCVYHKSQTAY